MKQRVHVALACDECGSRNYQTTKKKQGTERLSLQKFCPKCQKHTLHKESR
jgi:large subunit ribosomal protein L33